MFIKIDQNTIGGRIRLMREEREMTQEKLADRVGMTKQTIHSIEAGRTKKSFSFPEIARVLGVNLDWLKTGCGEKKINRNSKFDEKDKDKDKIIHDLRQSMDLMRQTMDEMNDRLYSVERRLYRLGI